MSAPQWLANLGSETPTISEYLAQPDLRLLCSLFLGWLSFLSLYYLATSSVIRSLLLRIRSGRLLPLSPTRSTHSFSSVDDAISSKTHHGDRFALTFLLNLVTLTTAGVYFASLLSFTQAKTACIFFTAWGGLGAQSVRVFGLLKLTLHLREAQGKRWESWLLGFWLFISAVFMFLTTALTRGTIETLQEHLTTILKQPLKGDFLGNAFVAVTDTVSRRQESGDITMISTVEQLALDQLSSIGFCYRPHLLFVTAFTSGLNVLLEVYLLVRLLSLILPDKRQLHLVFTDIRVARVLSLLVLDGMTVWPNTDFINIASDYLPFAFGAMLVLVAFNTHPGREYYLSKSSSVQDVVFGSTSTETTGPILPSLMHQSSINLPSNFGTPRMSGTLNSITVAASPSHRTPSAVARDFALAHARSGEGHPFAEQPKPHLHPFASDGFSSTSMFGASKYDTRQSPTGNAYLGESAPHDNKATSPHQPSSGLSSGTLGTSPPTRRKIVEDQSIIADLPRLSYSEHQYNSLLGNSTPKSHRPQLSLTIAPPLRTLAEGGLGALYSPPHEADPTPTPNSATHYGSDIIRPSDERNSSNVLKQKSRFKFHSGSSVASPTNPAVGRLFASSARSSSKRVSTSTTSTGGASNGTGRRTEDAHMRQNSEGRNSTSSSFFAGAPSAPASAKGSYFNPTNPNSRRSSLAINYPFLNPATAAISSTSSINGRVSPRPNTASKRTSGVTTSEGDEVGAGAPPSRLNRVTFGEVDPEQLMPLPSSGAKKLRKVSKAGSTGTVETTTSRSAGTIESSEEFVVGLAQRRRV